MSMNEERRKSFDPAKVRFDISLDDALSLTAVRSKEDFSRLLKRLPELRGLSYVFVNVALDIHRLVLTTIVGEGDIVTWSVVLDHRALGVNDEMLKRAVKETGLIQESGCYPISREIEERLRAAFGRSAKTEC